MNITDLQTYIVNVLEGELDEGQFDRAQETIGILKLLAADPGAKPLNKVSGQPFRIAEIEAAIEEALQ